MVFKRLADARRDGDRIYAAIKALGSASDGRSSSIYAPRAEGQMKALRSAYHEAGVSPDTIELIEAHGTGTRVGDEVEFSALRQVFTEDAPSDAGNRKNWCAIGTVKSMIGHTKAAAGAAGVIKSVLSLYHKVLPPTLKADEPDPRLNIEESPFYLSTRPRPWLSTGRHPRRAGVSAFGFGGSNFHMVLEEYDAEERGVAWDGSVEIFALSGTTREEIESRLSGIRGDVDGMADEDISALAARSRAEFSAGSPHRLLVVIEKTLDRFENMAGVFSDALDALKHNVKETIWNVQNIFYGGPVGDFGKLAFVFPGQGSQYVDMGRDLVCRFPEAMKVMDMANAAVEKVGWLGDWVYPRPARSAAEREAQENRLRQTEVAQPAIGAVSLAMARILQRFGLMPDSVCGHSFGELSALCAAGWIDARTFLELAFTRGKLMGAAGQAGAGAMTAVKAPLDEIDRLIRDRGLDVVLANRNTPEQGVISGTVAAIEQAEDACHALDIQTRRLPVSAAFHSRLMAAAQAPFAEAVGRIQMHPTDTQVFSNATGRGLSRRPRPGQKAPGRPDAFPGRFCPGDQDPAGCRGSDLCGGRAEINYERPDPIDSEGASLQRCGHGCLIRSQVRHCRPGQAPVPSGGAGAHRSPGPVGGEVSQKTETADEHPHFRCQLSFTVQKETRLSIRKNIPGFRQTRGIGQPRIDSI